MTDSEIIKDWVNLQLPMTCTSALPTSSMSGIVFINVGEFCFASAPFHTIPFTSTKLLESESKLLNMNLTLSMNHNHLVICFFLPKGVSYLSMVTLTLKLMYFSLFSAMTLIDPKSNFFPNSLINRCT